jgi:hypothetical protein
MAKATPTLEDVPTVGVQGERPVATYNPGILSQGVQALTAGGQHLGAGIEQAGKDVADVEQQKARNQALNVQDSALGEAIQLREKYKHDTDYATLPERYGADLQAIQDKHLATIPAGPLRDHANARMQIPFAREQASVSEQAFASQRNNWRSGIMDEADQLINTTGAQDDPLHTAKMEQWATKVHAGREQGLISPVEAEQLLRKTSTGVIDGEFRARFRSGREEAARALYELEGAQSGDPYVARLFHIESGGNRLAVTGSNRGLGQFGPTEERRYGITDENRTDPRAQARAVQLEAQDNAPAISRAIGRKATDADLYLAHQQGQAGAVALLTNPAQPAWQAIRKYYGSDTIAKQAIYGNIPNGSPLKGVPVEQISSTAFTNMWKDKFEMGGRYVRAAQSGDQTGEEGPGQRAVSPAYDILTPPHRDTLIREGQTVLHAFGVDDERQLREQEKARKAQAQGIEDEYLKDAYSPQPQKTTADVANDPRLEGDPTTKKQIISIIERTNKPDPIAKVSQETTRRFMDQMSLPYGDPNKLTGMEPIKDAFIAGKLSRSDFDWLDNKFKSSLTPEGEKWDKHFSGVEKAVMPKITKTEIQLGGITDTEAGQRVYDWHQEVERRKAQLVKEGKNPHDLLDPAKPEYVGSDKFLEPYRASMEKTLSKLRLDTDAQHSDKPAATGAPFDVKQIKTKEDAVAAYQAHRITKEQADQMALERGWATRRAPSAPTEAPHVPVSQ